MSWDSFGYFAVVSMVLALAGALVALCRPNRTRTACWLTLGGIAALACFVVGFWVTLGRPPMRTMGETRLWYSLCVLIAGLLVYRRWRFRWVLLFTTVMASVFCLVNLLKPEIHDATLVPALQSVFFVPHVVAYMFAYGILACAFLLAVAGVADRRHSYLESIDNLVYIGTGLLFVGLLTGSV